MVDCLTPNPKFQQGQGASEKIEELVHKSVEKTKEKGEPEIQEMKMIYEKVENQEVVSKVDTGLKEKNLPRKEVKRAGVAGIKVKGKHEYFEAALEKVKSIVTSECSRVLQKYKQIDKKKLSISSEQGGAEELGKKESQDGDSEKDPPRKTNEKVETHNHIEVKSGPYKKQKKVKKLPVWFESNLIKVDEGDKDPIQVVAESYLQDPVQVVAESYLQVREVGQLNKSKEKLKRLEEKLVEGERKREKNNGEA